MTRSVTSRSLKISGHTLAMRQSYNLDLKVRMTQQRVRRWYERFSGNVYVAFSGGKDSSALLHLVRELYPQVPAVFVDTGLEYPELRRFVASTPNVTWLRPSLTFREVLDRHGWPVVSKAVANAVLRIRSPGSSERTRRKALYGDERGTYHRLPLKWRFLLDAPFAISDKCCEVMKMRPIDKYHQQTGAAAIVGVMAEDSNTRRFHYMKHGCYLSHLKVPKCTPLGFWRTADIWEYIRAHNLPYCPVYDSGVKHTGCVYCCFGVQAEPEPNRFQRLAITHPVLFRYCMNTLGLRQVLDFLGVPYSLDAAFFDKLIV